MDHDPHVPSTDLTASSTGLPSTTAGPLTYLLGIITGILFLVLEKKDPFVRFHAAQSIGVTVVFIVGSVALSIVTMILGVIPILGWLVGLVLSLAFALVGLTAWVLLMYKAWKGEEWEFPFIGEKVREMLAGSRG
jgi:uncharacterized membrane protein